MIVGDMIINPCSDTRKIDINEALDQVRDIYQKDLSELQQRNKELENLTDKLYKKIEKAKVELRKTQSALRELISDKCTPEKAVENAKSLLNFDDSMFYTDGLVNRDMWLECVAQDLSEKLFKAGLDGKWPKPPQLTPWINLPPKFSSILSS